MALDSADSGTLLAWGPSGRGGAVSLASRNFRAAWNFEKRRVKTGVFVPTAGALADTCVLLVKTVECQAC